MRINGLLFGVGVVQKMLITGVAILAFPGLGVVVGARVVGLGVVGVIAGVVIGVVTVSGTGTGMVIGRVVSVCLSLIVALLGLLMCMCARLWLLTILVTLVSSPELTSQSSAHSCSVTVVPRLLKFRPAESV